MQERRQTRSLWLYIGAAACTLFGYMLSHYSAFGLSYSSPLGNGESRRLFVYQQQYGEAPSESNEALWKDLFPTQGGYFRHPELAKERSAFSVFHQLHCLIGIRDAYWTLFHFATNKTEAALDPDKLAMMASPPHIRHCIDLLRQSLMCNPDTTIEVKNKKLGGVTGFGTEHVCRDWNHLVEWTSKWENYGQETDI